MSFLNTIILLVGFGYSPLGLFSVKSVLFMVDECLLRLVKFIAILVILSIF